MKMKQSFPFFLVLIIVMFSLELFAQNPPSRGGRSGGFNRANLPAIASITGQVLDSVSGNPIEFATLALIHPMKDSIVSGAVTDKQGYFTISEIRPFRYRLEIDFMGYEKKVLNGLRFSRENPSLDLQKIYLRSSSIALDEVEVKADKAFVKTLIDRKVYSVDQILSASEGNAIEILENIPSIDVDIDGTVSLRGSSNVRVLLDGRPSGFTSDNISDLLAQIPGNTIDRIEVITNPSAKYDPEGMAGILNIVLKKNKLIGFNGNVQVGIGNQEYANAGLSLNYRKRKLNIFSNIGFNKGSRPFSGTRTQIELPPDPNRLIYSESNSERGRESILGKLGIEYSFTPKNILLVQSTISDRNSDRGEELFYTINEEAGAFIESYSRDNSNISSGNNWNHRLYFVHKFNRNNHQLEFDASRSSGEDDGTALFQQTDLDIDSNPIGEISSLIEQFTISDNEQTALSLDYTLPIGEKSKFEAGWKSSFEDDVRDFSSFELDSTQGIFILDSIISNIFAFNENIHAAYLSYGNRLGKLGIQLGLRGEIVRTESRLLDEETSFIKDYTSLYPSLHTKYDVNDKTEVHFSYSRRVRRPRSRQINPILDNGDPLNWRQGNPDLNPEYTNSLELGGGLLFDKIKFDASVYFRRTDNEIRRFKEYDSTQAVFISTYKNFDSRESLGSEASIRLTPNRRINATVSVNANRIKEDASNIFENLDAQSWSWGGKILFNIKAWQDGQIQFSGRYRSGRNFPQGSYNSFKGASMSFRQKLLDQRLSLSLSVNDLFNTYGFSYMIEREDFIDHSERRWSSRNFRINLQYRFGKFEQERRRSRSNGGERGDFDLEGEIE